MPKRDYQMPLAPCNDPGSIEFYIKALMNCNDALIAIKEHNPAFRAAQYEARNKDMLCIYMMLDSLQNLIDEIKAGKAFHQTIDEGLRAVNEVLPEYVISELHHNRESNKTD